MKISKYINKYSNDYRKFNKKAAGEGLKYIKVELNSLSDDISGLEHQMTESDTLNEYYSKYSKTIDWAKQSVSNSQLLLNEFANKYLNMIKNFTKTLERNHKKELQQKLGDDYAEALPEFVDSPEEAYEEKKGIYTKYKLIMQLFSGEDADLINRVIKYIGHEIKITQSTVNIAKEQLEKVVADLSTTPVDYSWLSEYEQLFKFAQLSDNNEDEFIELTEEDFVELYLTPTEKSNLKAIVDLWREYYNRIEDTGIRKVSRILQNHQDVIRSYIDAETEKVELIHNLFDRLRALKKMIVSYISSGEDKLLFRQQIGMPTQTALVTIDDLVYNLSIYLPKSANVYKYMHKLPKSPVGQERPALLFDNFKDESTPMENIKMPEDIDLTEDELPEDE